jgi:prepilin-type processing-associated H-X9-DG protein
MHRTYIIPVSINGWCDHCGYPSNVSVVKRIGQIARPKERIVFLEEKEVSPDAFQFPYNPGSPHWGPDNPSIMHNDGANFGFADGHADFREWQCQQTIDWIRRNYASPIPTYVQCQTDLDWMMNAVWGYP